MYCKSYREANYTIAAWSHFFVFQNILCHENGGERRGKGEGKGKKGKGRGKILIPGFRRSVRQYLRKVK
jgi:hypothetical protein